MRILGQIAAFFLALLAIPLFTLATCNLAIEQTLTAPETYEDLLNNDTIFENILPVALPAIMSAAEAHGGPPTMRGNQPPPQMADNPIRLGEITQVLPPDIWREVIDTLVPPEWLRNRTEEVFELVTGVLSGNIEVLDAPIDLSEIIARWSGSEARDAANLIVNNAPNCTRTQDDEIRNFVANGAGHLPICNPSTVTLRNQSKQIIIAWLGTVAEELPTEETTFAEFFDMDYDDVRAVGYMVEIDRQGLSLLFLCPMALLSLIVLLAVRSLRGLGAWFGSVGIGTGALLMVLLFGLQLVLINSLSELLTAQDEVEVFFSQIASDFLVSAFGRSGNIMLVQAAAFFAVGFIFLLIAFFAPRQENTDEGYILVTEDGQIISTASQRVVIQEQSTPTERF